LQMKEKTIQKQNQWKTDKFSRYYISKTMKSS
jgi:hypothetical protein